MTGLARIGKPMAAIIAALVGLFLWQLGHSAQLPELPLIGTSVGFAIYGFLGLYPLLSPDTFENKIWRFYTFSYLFGYVLYALTTQVAWDHLGIGLGYLSLTLGLVFWAQQQSKWRRFAYTLLFAFLWVPLDARWLQHLWTWPEGKLGYVFPATFVAGCALLLLRHPRGTQAFKSEYVKFQLQLSLRDLGFLLIALIALIACVLPPAIFTGFVQLTTTMPSALQVVMTLIYITFMIALPEELLFRGVLWRALAFRSEWLTLGVTSILFGLSHYNNTPTPDWRYLTLATIAGGFYGVTKMKTKNLWVAILLHALVDLIWSQYFPSRNMM